MILSSLIVSTTAFSGTEIDALKDRITALESNKSMVEFSGLIEVGYAKNDDSNGKKELGVSTIELSVSANINEQFNANIVFLAEADENGDLADNPVTIDETTLRGNIQGVDFSVGKLTAPFGTYETALVSDPAGLDIGETGGIKALVLSTQINNMTLSAWSAPGSDSNHGFSIGYEGDNFAVGVDTIKDVLEAGNADGKKATALHTKVEFGDISIIAEQVKVKVDGADNKKETQLELNYAMDDWTLAVRRDGGDAKSNAYGFSYDIAQGVSFSAEHKKPKIGDHSTELLLTYEF